MATDKKMDDLKVRETGKDAEAVKGGAGPIDGKRPPIGKPAGPIDA